MYFHRLVFFGSDHFSSRVLRYLLKRNLCPVEVVTKKGSILDQFSASEQLVRHRWPLDVSSWGGKEEPFDIGLVASFGHLIDEDTVRKFRYGLFNVHPSLLPRYRGSSPIQAAIRDGITETGCTIMRIPPIAKFDIGEVILQKRLEIKQGEYAHELRDRLADVGAAMAEELLLNYEQCIRKAKPQGDHERSYARKIKPEQGLICFTIETSQLIDRKVRAYTGFIDLFTICCNGLKVKLEGMRDPDEVERYDIDKLMKNLFEVNKTVIDGSAADIPAGTIFFHKIRHLLCIKCQDGKWLAFEYATPEFKPKMSSLEFYNGYLSKIRVKKMITER